MSRDRGALVVGSREVASMKTGRQKFSTESDHPFSDRYQMLRMVYLGQRPASALPHWPITWA